MRIAINKIITLSVSALLLILFCGEAFCEPSTKIIHAFVALCDNELQGIIPVPKKLGDGLDPKNNLYWGAMYGVKTYFTKSGNWKLIETVKAPSDLVLERCVFKHAREDVFFVADAYKGAEIKRAIIDFIDSASGNKSETIYLKGGPHNVTLNIASGASLLAYIGHDGLMEFNVAAPSSKGGEKRDLVILACTSKTYFNKLVRSSGANPLIWTTGFMAPEAYTLESVIEGWIAGEPAEKIRERAAKAYKKYQNCTLRGAMNLFATGF